MVTPPTGPKGPAGPGVPIVPSGSSSGKIPVQRPPGDLHPKFTAGAKIGALFGVLVIIGSSVSGIADKLGLDLPTVLTSLLGVVATLGAVYAKAGDGR